MLSLYYRKLTLDLLRTSENQTCHLRLGVVHTVITTILYEWIPARYTYVQKPNLAGKHSTIKPIFLMWNILWSMWSF